MGCGFSAILNVGTAARELGKVKFLKSPKTGKVGNFSTKTAKPKFSKIRQKSNFGPIVRICEN